jgi:hypothetical protein
MAKIGRKPKANVLTVFGGKLDPLPEKPPAGIAGDPDKRALYAEIRKATSETGHLLRMHLPLVCAYVQAVSRMNRMDAAIDRDGTKHVGDRGDSQNPDVRTWRTCCAIAAETARELALTPQQLQALRTDLRPTRNGGAAPQGERLVDFLPSRQSGA